MHNSKQENKNKNNKGKKDPRKLFKPQNYDKQNKIAGQKLNTSVSKKMEIIIEKVKKTHNVFIKYIVINLHLLIHLSIVYQHIQM